MNNQLIRNLFNQKENCFYSLIPENQPAVFAKQLVVYTSRFEKQR